ncbi:unnamed protein product [marine sediment metagenome]|uniref:Uncharacterized protein n=1 Tax=marine sediment metagenome TaxID=412755 RepID=X1FYM5_9ZZZZ
MNIVEFKRGLDKLELVFKPLTVEQIDLYFDRLRFLSEELYNNSIDYILDTYKDKVFPKPADFLEATTKVGLEGSPGLPEYSGIKCDMCKDIGYILTLHANAQPSACPCGCKLGEKIKQGWIDSFKRKKK